MVRLLCYHAILCDIQNRKKMLPASQKKKHYVGPVAISPFTNWPTQMYSPLVVVLLRTRPCFLFLATILTLMDDFSLGSQEEHL
jgi:hypothetical protein